MQAHTCFYNIIFRPISHVSFLFNQHGKFIKLTSNLMYVINEIQEICAQPFHLHAIETFKIMLFRLFSFSFILQKLLLGFL